MPWKDRDPSGTVRLDTSDLARAHIRLVRYLKIETLAQILAGDMTAYIPEIVEVYSHRPNVVIVMDLVSYEYQEILDSAQSVRPSQEYPPEYDDGFLAAPRLRPCSGTHFEDDHTPAEMQGASEPGSRSLAETVEAQMCMVFHSLLQAFHHMFDRGLTHLDFEGRNFLVDASFQVRFTELETQRKIVQILCPL